VQEVEKYLSDYKRVKYCILKGIDEERISFVLRMSKKLVKEYIEIIHELGDVELEKELENDLVDYKITLERDQESVVDDFDLEDL
jgi:hypothetical protein